jgi:hypothetical protein
MYPNQQQQLTNGTGSQSKNKPVTDFSNLKWDDSH